MRTLSSRADDKTERRARNEKWLRDRETVVATAGRSIPTKRSPQATSGDALPRPAEQQRARGAAYIGTPGRPASDANASLTRPTGVSSDGRLDTQNGRRLTQRFVEPRPVGVAPNAVEPWDRYSHASASERVPVARDSVARGCGIVSSVLACPVSQCDERRTLRRSLRKHRACSRTSCLGRFAPDSPAPRMRLLDTGSMVSRRRQTRYRMFSVWREWRRQVTRLRLASRQPSKLPRRTGHAACATARASAWGSPQPRL